FALRRFELAEDAAAVDIPRVGPGIMLVTAGTVLLSQAGSELPIAAGSAAWISATDTDIQARALGGPAQLFCACVGEAID
ncbi:hypothetical protein ACWD5S_12225, partial [Micrococcus luteus]